LTAKEKELHQSIQNTANSKLSVINSELKKAENRIKEIDESISFSGELENLQNDPISFLKKVEEMEEQVRHATATADPQIVPAWFQMPQIVTSFIEQSIKNLKYKEKFDQPFHGQYIDDSQDQEEQSEEADDLYS